MIEISVKPKIKNNDDGTINVSSVKSDTWQGVVPPPGLNSGEARSNARIQTKAQMNETAQNTYPTGDRTIPQASSGRRVQQEHKAPTFEANFQAGALTGATRLPGGTAKMANA